MGKIASSALLAIALGVFGCSQATTTTRLGLTAAQPIAGSGNQSESGVVTPSSGATNPSGVDVVTAGINGAPVTGAKGNTDLASVITINSIALGENDSTASILIVSLNSITGAIGVAISGGCGSPTKVTTTGSTILNIAFPPSPIQGSTGCALAIIASDNSETPFTDFPNVPVPTTGTPPGGTTNPPGGTTNPPGGGTTNPPATNLASKITISSITIGENDSNVVVLVVDATDIPDVMAVGITGSCGAPSVPQVTTIGLTGLAVAFPPSQVQGSAGCALAIIASDNSETAFTAFPNVPVPTTGGNPGTGTIRITGAKLFENDSDAVAIEFTGPNITDAAGDLLGNCANADGNADAFPDPDGVGLDFVYPSGDILGMTCALTLFDSSNDPSNQVSFTVNAGTPLGALTLTPN